jgi:hypothetical protein
LPPLPPLAPELLLPLLLLVVVVLLLDDVLPSSPQATRAQPEIKNAANTQDFMLNTSTEPNRPFIRVLGAPPTLGMPAKPPVFLRPAPGAPVQIVGQREASRVESKEKQPRKLFLHAQDRPCNGVARPSTDPPRRSKRFAGRSVAERGSQRLQAVAKFY